MPMPSSLFLRYIVQLGNLTYRFLGLKSMEKTSEKIVGAIQELICLSYELKVQQMSRAKAAPGELGFGLVVVDRLVGWGWLAD